MNEHSYLPVSALLAVGLGKPPLLVVNDSTSITILELLSLLASDVLLSKVDPCWFIAWVTLLTVSVKSLVNGEPVVSETIGSTVRNNHLRVGITRDELNLVRVIRQIKSPALVGIDADSLAIVKMSDLAAFDSVEAIDSRGRTWCSVKTLGAS